MEQYWRGKMRKVLLDTNFILSMAEKPNIKFEEEFSRVLNGFYQLLTLKRTIDELKLLKSKAKSISKLRKYMFGLEFISKKCKIIDTSNGDRLNVDELIGNVATREKYIVATNDKELRKKLKAKGIPVIYIRQGMYLELNGEPI